MRLLRYKREDPSTVDPYWDFEHESGEMYDMDALRLWRARVFISGTPRARVRLRFELHQSSPGGEPKPLELSPPDHILRFTGGPDLSPDSYAPISSEEISASPPMLVLAVNLTRLSPGEYVLTTEAVGSDQDEREMRFRIERRPFYVFSEEAGAASLRDRVTARSSTGLTEVHEDGLATLLTAHAWTVHRNSWTTAVSAYAGELRHVLAATTFRPTLAPEQTRWHFVGAPHDVKSLSGWSRADFAMWSVPHDHEAASEDGLGLPFPILLGLKRQPNPDGGYNR
jgi:hypothetical protein